MISLRFDLVLTIVELLLSGRMFVGCGCILCLWGFGAMSNIIMP